MASQAYHSLLVLFDNRWTVEFSSYSKSMLEIEAKALPRGTVFWTITTPDDEISISQAVASLNAARSRGIAS